MRPEGSHSAPISWRERAGDARAQRNLGTSSDGAKTAHEPEQRSLRSIPRPLSRLLTRAVYASTQLPRLTWYIAHFYILRELAAEYMRQQGGQQRPSRSQSNTRLEHRLNGDLWDLFARDLANVEAGVYPLPADHDGSLLKLLERSRLFFRDLPAIEERRRSNATHEVRTVKTRGSRPAYYLQNFHFQSGGWLTEASAELYDTQVEVLFKGAANAMRRQALQPLAETFAGRDQRKLRLIDLGCGTGRFVDFVKQKWPRLPVLGLDLSEPYIRYARRHLRRWSRTKLVVANAESIPVPDRSCDAVTSIFMLHELPPTIRQKVIAEAARVLRPGGRLILMDSLQRGDIPAYDTMLESFPERYHEPYYGSYLGEQFPAIAHRYGLLHRSDTKAFLSKVMVFDKPAAGKLKPYFSSGGKIS